MIGQLAVSLSRVSAALAGYLPDLHSRNGTLWVLDENTAANTRKSDGAYPFISFGDDDTNGAEAIGTAHIPSPPD